MFFLIFRHHCTQDPSYSLYFYPVSDHIIHDFKVHIHNVFAILGVAPLDVFHIFRSNPIQIPVFLSGNFLGPSLISNKIAQGFPPQHCSVPTWILKGTTPNLKVLSYLELFLKWDKLSGRKKLLFEMGCFWPYMISQCFFQLFLVLS